MQMEPLAYMNTIEEGTNGFKKYLRIFVRQHAILRPAASFFLRQLYTVGSLWSRLTRRSSIERYLHKHAVRSLHLGCSANIHKGWLNTDLRVLGRRAIFLDATRPFPLPDDSIDYVFSEHMIEHVSYLQGLFMLRECYRVLKPGGRIRIATPNLEFLLKLHSREPKPDAEEYVTWFRSRNMPHCETIGPAFVINHYFYNWGHCFIYDRATLEGAFREVGLKTLEWCAVGESACPVLRNLEKHGDILASERWNVFETMVLEGVKP